MIAGLHKKNTCIIIVGPTAAGKTALAMDLAEELDTRIISADARQCFRELNIGVAKPSLLQLEQVKHYFIDSHSILDQVNAGVFEGLALEATTEIFLPRPWAVMAGGTGLYIKAFTDGMDKILHVAPEIRAAVREGFEKSGLAWLQENVKSRDPDYFTAGEIQNPQRLMRCLEVLLATGRSIRSFQSGRRSKRDFNIMKIGIEWPREQLYRNINRRVDDMITQGLVEEVKGLLPYRHLNALNTVGYKELFSYLEGGISLDEATDIIKRNTRHYAKRQMTWFKKDLSIRWIGPEDGCKSILSKM